MANIQEQQTLTGNLILLKIEGQEVGAAQGLDPRFSFGTEGTYELGTIMPREHVHLRYESTFTLERLCLRKDNLQKMGLIGLGEDILSIGVIDIEVQDKSSGKTLQVFRDCTFTDYTLNYRTNAIVGENATVQALSADGGE